jgi:hypothetical protein
MSGYSRAIVTLCIGDSFEKLAHLTHPLMCAYAEKVRADFVVIDKPRLNISPIHYEKYQLAHLLDRYERILFVDTDVVIRPNSPDLFESVPINMFGAYLASEHSDCHDASIRKIQDELGNLGWEKDYFNSGVMMLSGVHQAMFDFKLGCFNGFYEQTQLNYNLQKLKLPFFDIGFQYNHVQLIGEPISKGTSYFIHYAGPGHGDGPRHIQIAEQFKELLAKIN